MFLNQSIDNLPTTRFLTIKQLKTLDIETYWDLLNYFPFRYEDYSLVSPINQLQAGEKVTIKGEVTRSKLEFTKKSLKIVKVILQDKTGEVESIWYNQPYLVRLFKTGILVSLAGEVKLFTYGLIIEPKEYEILSWPAQPTIHSGRIVPIYPEKTGLSSKTLREKIFFLLQRLKQKTAIDEIKEILPQEIVKYNKLLSEFDAYQNIHFPKNLTLAEKARVRLAFDELFMIQLSAYLTKKEWQKEKVGQIFKINNDVKGYIDNFIEKFPFRLTNGQNKTINEIFNDLVKPQPMNRFLQGDVGSGKTAVATIAAYLAFLNHYQTLFMAPTEILANQHYQTIKSLFITNLSRIPKPKMCLVTASHKPKDAEIKEADIIIGTHALIQKKIAFKKVGLVIVDEQHRFGVAQRALLKQKGLNSHLLTMTATPIPRTVALTLYGELDLSYLDEMPEGRLLTKTYLVPKNKRDDGYQWIQNKIVRERVQVFVICPLIEESDKETLKSVKAAKTEFRHLKENVFPKLSLGLIHGKMTSREKNQVMTDFKNNRYQILVATSLVEVGIDVPNANIMIVEGAERFGLAQLHQLRGRIGRSNKQAYCFLLTEAVEDKVIERLNFFVKISSGVKLAEYDLQRRGPGEIYGTKQHGFIALKIATFSDFRLLKQVKSAVEYFVKNYPDLDRFPEIKRRLSERQNQITEITRD